MDFAKIVLFKSYGIIYFSIGTAIYDVLSWSSQTTLFQSSSNIRVIYVSESG